MDKYLKSIISILMTGAICWLANGCHSKEEDRQPQEVLTNTMEAQMMFSGVETTLTPDEMNQVVEISGLKINNETGRFQMEGEDAEVQLMPLDMNNDKKEEIFIITFSMFLYGNTGQGFTLLMKDGNNQYESVLSLPGIPELIYDGNSELPAIQVGGPGFDFPVYVWKNSHYVLDKSYKVKNKVTPLEELSRKYTSSLK
ncbi:MAG: hypothetical protein HS118_07630 [Bacteroidia bacterium]|nr:hypothetical protein [Bacteroidia bacterium]